MSVLAWVVVVHAGVVVVGLAATAAALRGLESADEPVYTPRCLAEGLLLIAANVGALVAVALLARVIGR